jgi:hypothetical protein
VPAPAAAGAAEVGHEMTDTTAQPWPTEECLTCKAPIIWTVNARTLNPMPVDAEPVLGGNLALAWEEPARTRVLSRVLPTHLAYGRRDLHLSHFVKCPQAPRWRRRGGDRHAA